MEASVKNQTVPEAAYQNVRARLENRTEEAFVEGERQGLMLAAKVRTIALLIIILWQSVYTPDTGPAYFYGLLEVAVFAVLGVVQYFCAKQRLYMHVLKYIFVFIDCAMLAFVIGSPDPFAAYEIPPAVALDGSRASYFYILLMQSTFSLRPHLVLWCGLCIVAARSAVLFWFISQPNVFTNIDLPEQTVEAFVIARADPNFIFLGFWATEVMVTIIVVAGLAFVVRRSQHLVASRSSAERTRASLARYFSPNVVDHLSGDKDPLGSVREQEVAILFADIMGFTKLCENAPPDRTIALLRDYHNRLGQAVFDNSGTLDKYIGDGLMASFGTPEPGPNDAKNALKCAMDMIAALAAWNAERIAEGAVPVRVGIGVHFGVAIAGDIGNERRLEYSVIGDTVNIASRLEQLTRSLETSLVVSDSLVMAIDRETAEGKALLRDLSHTGEQKIRGRDAPVDVWTLNDTALPS